MFAVVRNPDSSHELRELAGPNVHIIAGDLDRPETLHVRIVLCPDFTAH